MATTTDADNTRTATAFSNPTAAVAGLADTPMVSTPDNVSMNENATGVALTNLSVTPGDPSASDAADTFTATLSVANGTIAIGAAGSAGVAGSGTGFVTLSGSLADVNTGLGNASYTPNSEFEGSDTLTFAASATDDISTSAVASSTTAITVAPVADPPVVTVPGDDFTLENQPVTITGIQAVLASGDEDDALSLNLSVAHGTLALGSTSGLTVTSDGSTGTLAFSGSQADISNALASGVIYTPANEYEADDPLTVTATETEGNGSAATTTAVMPLTVNPVADTPTVTLPALPTSTGENGSLLWQNITITAAAGDGDDPLSIYLNVGQGTLALSSTTGLTVTSDGSNGTLLVSGNEHDLNAALAAGVTYTPTAEYEGVDTLDVVGTATESNGNAASTQQQLVGLTVNGVADTPVVSVPLSSSGLLGYWPFNGNANDTSGNGNDLSLSGGATFSAGGQFGQALSLDGVEGSYVQATSNNTAFDFGSGDFTVQVWANFRQSPGVDVLAEKFTSETGPGWSLYTAGSNDVQFYADGQVILDDPSANITPGAWNDFTVERSGSTFHLFIDGTDVADGNYSAALQGTSNPLLIGARNAEDGRNFTVDGLMDDVGIWGRALSASEIAQSWNNGAGVQLSALTTTENATNVAINGLSVAPGDGSANDAADTFTATVSVLDGTLAVGAYGGAMLSGGGTNTVTLTGSLADVSAGLANVSYTPNAEFEGTDTLTLSATSTDGSSTSAAASQSATITVNGVADVPVVSVPLSSSGLLGYWPFNGNANDTSGNGNILALFGGATFAAGGQFGQALSLDGVPGSFARQPTNNTAFDFSSGDFTVQVWAKFNNITNGREETLIEKWTAASGPGWTFTLPGGNDIRLDGGANSVGGPLLDSGPVSIPNGVWQQFVLERSGNTYEIFWDGNLVASTTNSTPLTASPNDLLIGARDAQDPRNFTIDGLIDDTGIWGRALSASEVAQSWNNGAGTQLSALTTTENATNVAIDGLSVAPGDGSASDAADTFTATVSVADGTLAVGAHGGVTLSGGGGTWTLSGSLPDVNTGLANVSYTPNAEFEGTDTLTLSATATDGTSTSAAASSSATITVNGVADTPSVSAPNNVTTSENATDVALTGLSVSTVDGSDNDAADTFTATVSVADGTLAVGAHGGAALGGNDGATVTLTGTLADVNTGLANVSYTPNTEFEGTDTVHFSARASEGGGAPSAEASSSAVVTVNGVADTPTESTPAAKTLNENSSVGLTSLSVAAGDSSSNDNNDIYNVALSVAHGSLSMGGAHTGLTGTFSGSSVNFSGSLSNVNAALANNNITYSPTSGFQGTDTLTFKAITTEDFGTSTSTTATQTATLTVNSPQKAVEIVGAPALSSWLSDVQAKLVATGDFSRVDTFNASSGTPTLSNLESYAAVLVFSDAGFQNSTQLGNNLDAYMQADGGVVTAVFTNTDNGFGLLSSSFANDFAFSPSGSQLQGTELTLGTVHNTSSPLVAGVTSFDGGSSSYHGSATLLSGSVDVADYNNGTPLIVSRVVYGYRTVGLNFYPVSNTERSDFWLSNTSGATIMADALENVGSTALAPAGVAGAAINMALSDPSGGAAVTTFTETITGIPSGWALNGGTNLGNGTWTVQTSNPAALTITPAISFVGAVQVTVTEAWTNSDGTAGNAVVLDNVEAYAAGSPIFARAGSDTLTGSGGNDEFVFAQPITRDVIDNFNVASDTIDLIRVGGVASFQDIQTNLANDPFGNGVITLGSGQTITLNGVGADSLSASNFVFDQQLLTQNPGTMIVGDGAILPLGGEIHNTGSVTLASTGDQTYLQVQSSGARLTGGGQINMSDDSGNVIASTTRNAVLTNIDNTISGAGEVGAGSLGLVNDGIIDATGTNPLVIDTGANAIDNSGTLQTDGGTLVAQSAVTGRGSAIINGGTMKFAIGCDANVSFGAGATETLQLDQSQSFTGSVSGFGREDQIDLGDIGFGTNITLSYTPNSGNSGGTLTVSDGTNTANLALLGQYVASAFATASDGHGGTLITDPPPPTGDQTTLGQPHA
jgi:hypothetical protein